LFWDIDAVSRMRKNCGSGMNTNIPAVNSEI